MRDDVQAIHRRYTGTLAVRQTQTPADGLLDQRAGIGSTQRHDGIEIGHIPAFLEHIDVNHDLGWFVHTLHREQTGDHFLLFAA